MPRKRKGQLLRRKSGYAARIVVTIDGERVRRVYDLGTRDEVVARAKMKRLLAETEGGISSTDDVSTKTADKRMTFREAAELANRKWETDEISTRDQRMSLLRRYAFPHIGDRFVGDIRGAEIGDILDAAKRMGREKPTVANIKMSIGAVMKYARIRELITHDPMELAVMPRWSKNHVVKERVVPRDAEISALLCDPERDLEIQTLVASARTIGGQRSGALNAADWTQIDLATFGRWRVIRKKVHEDKWHTIPEPVRPYLRRWWQACGEPTSGPIFPTKLGKHAGEARGAAGRRTSYAARFRRELKRALGVEIQDAEGRWREVPRKHWTPRWVELFTETPTTKPTDFHSLRRAYATALGEAGLSPQQAMALTGHRSMAVHTRYLRTMEGHMPDSAVPQLVQTRPVPKRRVAQLPESGKAWESQGKFPPRDPSPVNEPSWLGDRMAPQTGDLDHTTIVPRAADRVSADGVGAVVPIHDARTPAWSTRALLACGELARAAVRAPDAVDLLSAFVAAAG